jgi:hypothetical protein
MSWFLILQRKTNSTKIKTKLKKITKKQKICLQIVYYKFHVPVTLKTSHAKGSACPVATSRIDAGNWPIPGDVPIAITFSAKS